MPMHTSDWKSGDRVRMRGHCQLSRAEAFIGGASLTSYSLSSLAASAALSSSLVVEKWKKWHSVPLLGIPNCVGFGLHADSYR